MSPITTHVLDTTLGKPGSEIAVVLQRENAGSWFQIGAGLTNRDGRLSNLLPDSHSLEQGIYRMHFALQEYFSRQNRKSFYPEVSITFIIDQNKEHYHVPLLLSDFGFSTYRGS